MKHLRFPAFLTAGCLLMTPLTSHADEITAILETTPGNMLHLDVVNQDGEAVEGVEVTLYHSDGTEVGCLYSEQKFHASSGSGLDATEIGTPYYYEVPWTAVTGCAAPLSLHHLQYESSSASDAISTCYPQDPLNVRDDLSYDLDLFCYDPAQSTALTVPANQFGFYVDPKWSGRTAEGYATTPCSTLYFNRQGSFDLSHALDTAPTGEVSLYSVLNPDYAAESGFTVENSGGSSSTSALEISSTATEYILCRIPLQQLDSRFNADGTFQTGGLLYDLTVDGKHTSAMLTIQSGAVLSFPIPDDDGYIEFYVEKNSLEFSYDFSYSYYDVTTSSGTAFGGSNFHGTGHGGVVRKIVLEPFSMPDDEIIITYIPKGTYTLSFDKIPQGYAAPKTTAITVTDSKEIQYISLTLENAFLLGDVNQDGSINAADASLVLVAAANSGAEEPSGLTAEQEAAADVNGDGTIDAVDASCILQYATYTGTGGTLALKEFLNTLI